MDTMTLTPVDVATNPEIAANNERRHAGRIAANARLAALSLTTRQDSKIMSAARNAACGSAEGEERKALARLWSQSERQARYTALDGSTVTLTLQADGKRWLASGLTDVSTGGGADVDTMRVSGLVSVIDATTSPANGCTVTVRLARRDSRPDKRGKVATSFSVTTVGVASNGGRVALRGRVTASRHVRIVASAL